MSAERQGITQGRKFTSKLETMTREQYRRIGRTEAEALYRSQEKQNEFMKGWFEINQRFFCFLKDGPKRRIIKVVLTIVCDVCGSEVDVEFEGHDIPIHSDEKYAACPVCEEHNT
jgi:hypothetical protein